MDWGVYLLTTQPPGQDEREVIKNMIKYAQAGEEMGFESAWLLEHHFTRFGLLGSPFVAASYILGNTSKLKVGTAANVITTEHPVRLLEEACLLDQMSDGRFKFGICRGLYDKDFTVFDVEMSKTRSILEHWYEIFKEGFETGRVKADNEHVSFPEVEFYPKPYTQNGPQVYMVAESPSSTEWVAKRGLPMVISWIITDEEKRSQMELYREVALEHGHDPDKIDHSLSYIAGVSHDGDAIREQCRGYLEWWYEEYLRATNLFNLEHDSTAGYEFQKGQWKEFVLRGHKKTERRIDYSYQINPVGTPEECVEIIQKGIDATGAKRVICGFESAGKQEEVLASMSLFKEEVMPRIRDRAALELEAAV